MGTTSYYHAWAELDLPCEETFANRIHLQWPNVETSSKREGAVQASDRQYLLFTLGSGCKRNLIPCSIPRGETKKQRRKTLISLPVVIFRGFSF
jgi:hypothetical protein